MQYVCNGDGRVAWKLKEGVEHYYVQHMYVYSWQSPEKLYSVRVGEYTEE